MGVVTSLHLEVPFRNRWRRRTPGLNLLNQVHLEKTVVTEREVVV